MTETATPGPAPAGAPPKAPVVRAVAMADILKVLAAGLRDFRAAPLYGLFIGGVYTLGGWLIVLLLIGFDLPYLVYPLAMGFALIAPFAATALYAVSRGLERGEDLSWGVVLGSAWGGTRRDIGWMALVTGFTLFLWIDIAALMFFGFFGTASLDFQNLLREVFTTPLGLVFLVVGNAVGAFIALAVFSYSVTSFPMLYDRDVDFVTAMVTSVKVVLASPRTMVLWCAIIAALIGLSLLSGLVGLLVVLPVLGHASWHLYRRAIAA